MKLAGGEIEPDYAFLYALSGFLLRALSGGYHIGPEDQVIEAITTDKNKPKASRQSCWSATSGTSKESEGNHGDQQNSHGRKA